MLEQGVDCKDLLGLVVVIQVESIWKRADALLRPIMNDV